MEVHTNNLVESWHNILKNVYLKGARKQRPDMLVYRLVEEVLQELRSKIALTLNGFIRRRINLAEQKQLDESDAISDEAAVNMVSRTIKSDESNLCVEEIQVCSFFEPTIQYEILLNDNGLIAKCSCPHMTTNSIVCKHMHLAARVLGHQICFDTRSSVLASNEMSPTLGLDLDTSDRREEAESEFQRFVNRIQPFLETLRPT